MDGNCNDVIRNGYYFEDDLEEEKEYKEFLLERQKKISTIKTYITIIITTAIITGAAVGGGLYYKFSKDFNVRTNIIEKSENPPSFEKHNEYKINGDEL